MTLKDITGPTRAENHGFSLVEVMLVLIVAGILLGAASPLFTGASRNVKADGAAQLVAQEFAYARSLSVMSHAIVTATFDPVQSTLVVSSGNGSQRGPFGLGTGIQVLSSPLTPDTPDNVGSTVLGTGGLQNLSFLDNGSVVDPVTGQLCSGTVFLQDSSGTSSTRRAITLMGATGRVKMWRYDVKTATWKQ